LFCKKPIGIKAFIAQSKTIEINVRALTAAIIIKLLLYVRINAKVGNVMLLKKDTDFFLTLKKSF